MSEKERDIKYRSVSISTLSEGDFFIKYDTVGTSPVMYEVVVNNWAHNDVKVRSSNGVINRIQHGTKIWVPSFREK